MTERIHRRLWARNAHHGGRRGGARPLSLAIAAVCLLAFAPRARAATYIYWADPSAHAISRANADGRHVVHDFIKHVQFACGLAIEGRYIYWANLYNAHGTGPGTTIGRARLNGTGVDNSFIRGADWPCGVAANSTSIYWADGPSQNPSRQGDEDGTIGEANLDGGGVIPALFNIGNGALGSGMPLSAVLEGALAVTDTQLYWGDWENNTIGTANLDGSDANDQLVNLPDGTEPQGLALTGSSVYWAGSFRQRGAIGTAGLDGSQVRPRLLQPSQGGICGMATDGRSLYWTWVNDFSLNSGVARVGLTGSGLNQFLTGRSGGVGCGIAVAQL
jgi:Low-density lipoprotein receptor repeat class B